MSSHMNGEIIGTIWFDNASSYPQTVTLIEEISEILWGANDDGTREPYTIEESIERLREFSWKALAWDNLLAGKDNKYLVVGKELNEGEEE